MNLADNLAASAASSPGRTALWFRGREITYRELDEQASRVAAALIHLGIEDGDRIAIWLPNHPAFVAALYGAWRVGAIVVPVNPVFTEHEASHILADSGAVLVFCTPRLHDSLSSTPAGPTHAVILGGEPRAGALTYNELLESGTGTFPGVELPGDHLALIAYTSGSEGPPKGAMLSHANLSANLGQVQATKVALRAGDVALCVLPLFHIFGLNCLLNLALQAGATVVLQERFDASGALEAVGDRGVCVLAGAPTVFVQWLQLPFADREHFAGIRTAVCGAAPLPAEVMTAFRDRFGVTIWEGYGLTETSPVVATTAVAGVAKPGSIGRALPGVDLRLRAEDGSDAEPGDPGEVLVRGDNVFRGYWQHPDLTAKVLCNGWFHTADVAVADDDGDLYIVDRKRDLILVSGFNVYPREVEDVLTDHPAIVDAAVVGVADTRTGERIKAYCMTSREVTEQDLAAFCRTRLAPFKVPKVIEFVSEIPRDAAGKVLRRVLR